MTIETFTNNTGSFDAFGIQEWVKAKGFSVKSATIDDTSIRIEFVGSITPEEKMAIETWLDEYLELETNDLATIPNLDKLREELTNDPTSIGYADMTAAEKAAAINAMTQTKLVPIPNTELLAWVGAWSVDGRPRLIKLKEAEADTDPLKEKVRSVAMTALNMMFVDGAKLDLNIVDRVQMVGLLNMFGVLSDEDLNMLYLIATQPANRAEKSCGGVPTLRDIMMAEA